MSTKDPSEPTLPAEPVTDTRPRYASVRHPPIAAIIKGLYRFENEKTALKRLEALRGRYVLSRRQGIKIKDDDPRKPKIDPNKEIVLWIRGFQITKHEEEKGYLGNFATLHVKDMWDQRYTIKADKLIVEPKFHPQRKRLQKRHPNWGHPIMRKIQGEFLYPTVTEAAQDLQRLHEEFPDISIPTGDKLYIMAYTRKGTEGGAPIKKLVLEIKLRPDGKCTIEWRENVKKPRSATPQTDATPPLPPSKDTPAPREQQGYFTALVELKKKRKKKPGIVIKPQAADD